MKKKIMGRGWYNGALMDCIYRYIAISLKGITLYIVQPHIGVIYMQSLDDMYCVNHMGGIRICNNSHVDDIHLMDPLTIYTVEPCRPVTEAIISAEEG